MELPEPDLKPPPFLSMLEAMTDVYVRSHTRVSPKTRELLTGSDLEDMLTLIKALREEDHLMRNPEARLTHGIWIRLKDDPGPLLLSFTDERLAEPWRLFLDGWEIWLPDKEKSGVELFWEGEAEGDGDRPVEILQTLTYTNAMITFHTRMGDLEDRITFDGRTFYRLKSPE